MFVQVPPPRRLVGLLLRLLMPPLLAVQRPALFSTRPYWRWHVLRAGSLEAAPLLVLWR